MREGRHRNETFLETAGKDLGFTPPLPPPHAPTPGSSFWYPWTPNLRSVLLVLNSHSPKPLPMPGELSTLQVSPGVPQPEWFPGKPPLGDPGLRRGAACAEPLLAPGGAAARGPPHSPPAPPPAPPPTPPPAPSSPAPSPGGRPLPAPRPALSAQAQSALPPGLPSLCARPRRSGAPSIRRRRPPRLRRWEGDALPGGWLCERAPLSAGGGRGGSGR